MKKSSGVKITRATKEDIDGWDFPLIPKGSMPTVIAWVGKLDGRILGWGGLMRFDGRWSAFCEVYEEGLQHKYVIARTALRVMADAKARGIKFVYADMDPKFEGAKRWAESLGFEVDPRSGILYRWRA